jgi:vesicle coat complex subunit
MPHTALEAPLTRSSGENWELRQQLNSEYRDKRADAIKRVIANHTIGKDCSGLFPDVVKNMVGSPLIQTPNRHY